MKPVVESLQEYARGITGGLLFSLPLLFTMEVWWAGFSAQPYQLLIYVAVTFLLLMGYNRYAGVHEGASWKEVLIDSVEEIGIGFVLSLVVLWKLGRIDFSEMQTDEIMGKVIVESMTVAIGVSVGTAQLGGDPQHNSGKGEQEKRGLSGFGHIVMAICGSILIAGNVAPTEEIPLIAMEITPARTLFIVLESLLLGTIILFFSDFRGGHRLPERSLILAIAFEIVTVYLLALSTSAFMLWFFGRFQGVGFEMAVTQVVVLGYPAVLGASAGRLLIKNH